MPQLGLSIAHFHLAKCLVNFALVVGIEEFFAQFVQVLQKPLVTLLFPKVVLHPRQNEFRCPMKNNKIIIFFLMKRPRFFGSCLPLI